MCVLRLPGCIQTGIYHDCHPRRQPDLFIPTWQQYPTSPSFTPSLPPSLPFIIFYPSSPPLLPLFLFLPPSLLSYLPLSITLFLSSQSLSLVHIFLLFLFYSSSFTSSLPFFLHSLSLSSSLTLLYSRLSLSLYQCLFNLISLSFRLTFFFLFLCSHYPFFF